MSDEIRKIMALLGRGQAEGEVKGSHCGRILSYFKDVKSEPLDSTMRKLPLLIGMSKRQIRENYVEGIIEFGIIKLYTNGSIWFWKWEGIESLNNEIPIEEPEPVTDDDCLYIKNWDENRKKVENERNRKNAENKQTKPV